jgi:DNA-binding NtrC family response regulator
LEKAIASGDFREDLFYRLSVIPIHVPSLRERREDIPLMARSFLERFGKAMQKPVEGIEPAVMAQLETYDWPGNVRELENTIERAVALETGRMISLGVLPEKIRLAGTPAAESARARNNESGQEHSDNGRVPIPESGLDLERYIQELERSYIVEALEASGGTGTRAAELLKMSYRSFRHYVKKYGIN